MIWQDILFTIGGFIFSISLIPTLRHKETFIPRSSSIQTAIILTAFLPGYYTLNLPLATISTSLTAIMWWLLAAFRGKRTLSQNIDATKKGLESLISEDK